MTNLLLILSYMAILLSVSEACHRKGIFDDKVSQGEVHHHHYNNYNPDGPGVPGPHQHPEPIYGPEGPEEPAKHVVVLQPAKPPPTEEDFFDLFPKKLHPKHFLKSHVHKLRSKFRDLFFDDKHGHHGHHHGHHKRPIPPPQVYHHQHPGNVAVPALKVPLIQVEAYKTAPYPGAKGHAVAYVSPDGYQPAVVVKQKPPHHHGYPAEVAQAQPPHTHYGSPPEAYQPTPQPVAYYNQPSYQHQPQPSYQPQPQPVAYQQSYPAQPTFQTQPVYGPQPAQNPSSPYGPQGYQSSQPLYEQPGQQGQFPSANYFGQSSQVGFGSPFSLDSSSFGATSPYQQ